ncbi:MAG: hypothetical protein WAM53_01800, partial [Terrimicrobiaceae bacterium]
NQEKATSRNFSTVEVPPVLSCPLKDHVKRTQPAGAANAIAATAGYVAANQSAQTGEEGPAKVETPENPNPAPVFNLHPDAIPPDASELSITGGGFSEATEIYVDDQPKAKSSLLEVTDKTLRIRFDPAELFDKTQIVVKARNPAPGGGESRLAIPVLEPGG